MQKRDIRFVLLFVIAFTFSLTGLYAQPSAGSWGLGIQIGEPSGLTIKRYNPSRMSFDALLAWDLDNFFFINIHGLWEKRLGSDLPLNFYYGPGAFVGIIEKGSLRAANENNEIALGISGNIGLNYYIDKFELYIQATPRLRLIDETDADIGGGLGFRFFF